MNNDKTNNSNDNNNIDGDNDPAYALEGSFGFDTGKSIVSVIVNNTVGKIALTDKIASTTDVSADTLPNKPNMPNTVNLSSRRTTLSQMQLKAKAEAYTQTTS